MFVAAGISAAAWNALSFAERVVAWQRSHGRSGLPWQQTQDPYRVWLSEIMLQQTQVTTVLGYYARFIERWPTVRDLAAALIDDVLAMWSGLGYYARARNLHACAQAVVARHGGEFPQASGALAELPGIGRSTAAAIASFCFGERVAILDGNVKRVLSRVLAFDGDLASAKAERELWDHATRWLPASALDMPAYTQGLMDLGATVCTVRAPRCDACPVASICEARSRGVQESYPVKTKKLRRGTRAHALLWLQNGDRVWLAPRPAQGVWASLWSMPEFEDGDAITRHVAEWPGTLEWLPPFRHVLTHFDWTLQPLKLTWYGEMTAHAQSEIEVLASGGRWIAASDLDTVGLPSPIRKLLEDALR